MVIWKAELGLKRGQKVSMPKGARVLSCGLQYGVPCIWFLCNSSNETEKREFSVYGTGHEFELSDSMTFIGTVLQPPFVWHVYEVSRP